MPDKGHAAPLILERSVWFFLITVRVIGNRQRWTAGTEAVVQAFVPGRRLEDALIVLDAYLPTQGLTRIDTSRAVRYDPADDDVELPGDYFRRPLECAAATNECVLGVFFVSQEDL